MLELVYDTKDGIPAGMEHLYEERGGKWHLTGVRGMKTQADVDRVNEALRKERNDHSQARAKLTAYTALGDDPQAIKEQLDEIPVLRQAATGKVDDSTVETLVERRLQAKTLPLQRQVQELTSERDTLKTQVVGFEAQNQQRTVVSQVRQAAATHKMLETAYADLELIAAHEFEVVDGTVQVKAGRPLEGMSPADWVREQLQARPHWWPVSEGGGAGGSRSNSLAGLDGPNPWTLAGWNMTKQADLLRKNRALAERCAKAAGVPLVGGRKPAK